MRAFNDPQSTLTWPVLLACIAVCSGFEYGVYLVCMIIRHHLGM